MRWASFNVPTHYRPQLLDLTLRSICAQRPVEGWDYEVLVIAQADDPAWDVVRAFARARCVSVESPLVGAKSNAALWAARGEILLCAGDDDLQSPNRLVAAVAAHEAGHRVSGTGVTLFYDWVTRRAARWEFPPGLVGSTMSWRTQWMREYGGWYELPEGNNTAMLWRLGEDGIAVHRLSDALGLDTMCTAHRANIGTERPFPDVGDAARLGDATVVGIEYEALPAYARELIEGHCGDVPGGAEPVREL